MATPLDTSGGLFQTFTPVLVWLLVFGFTYAFLQKVKLFGDDMRFSGLGAFVVATLFIATPGIAEVVSIATPWFMLFIIAIILMTMIFLFVGVDSKNIVKNVFEESTYIWLIIIICIGIFGFAMTQVYGDSIKSITDPGAEGGNVATDVAQILFTPKLLGFFLILAIASQAIRLIVK